MVIFYSSFSSAFSSVRFFFRRPPQPSLFRDFLISSSPSSVVLFLSKSQISLKVSCIVFKIFELKIKFISRTTFNSLGRDWNIFKIFHKRETMSLFLIMCCFFFVSFFFVFFHHFSFFAFHVISVFCAMLLWLAVRFAIVKCFQFTITYIFCAMFKRLEKTPPKNE